MADEHYYQGNDLQITCEVQRSEASVDLTDTSTRQIRYKKPDGTTGNWTATLSGTHQLVYNAADTDIDQSGTWYFRAYVVYNTGEIYQGDVTSLEIRKVWQHH